MIALNVKHKNITLVEENIGANLCDFGLVDGFLDITRKAF